MFRLTTAVAGSLVVMVGLAGGGLAPTDASSGVPHTRCHAAADTGDTREPAAYTTPGFASRRARGGVTVAVVDSGITLIPPLADAVNRTRSRSFVAGEALDEHDVHGTEIAAIIHHAAPDARLLILKTLDDHNGGTQADTAIAIRYAAAHGARVINVSASGAAPSPALRAAIGDARRHDALIVVAAGNDGLDLDVYPSYPASDTSANLVAVAATDGAGNLAANSNWGPHTVALGAPGIDIPTDTPNGTPSRVSGTSPAAALVSAAAAIALSRHPTLTTAALRRTLLDTTDQTPGMRGRTTSAGQLNTARIRGCRHTPMLPGIQVPSRPPCPVPACG